MPTTFHFEPPGVSSRLFPQNAFHLHYQHPQRLGEGQVPLGPEMEYQNDFEMEYQNQIFMEFE